MIYVLLGSTGLYVYAAYQHMRICHNDRSGILRLMHIGRLMAFIGLSFFLYDAMPDALFITSVYALITITIWFFEDMAMLRSDVELTSGVATDYRRLVKRVKQTRGDAA